MRIGRLVGAGAAGLGLVGAGYAGLGGQDDTTRDESGAVVEAGEVGAFRIRLGDCLLDVGAGSFESVEAVPCDAPHAYEVYGAFNLPAGPFPGQTQMEESANEGCYERFSAFVGIAYESSRYGYSTVTPTAESWKELDDREVLCLIGDPTGTVSGSLEGTAR